MIHNAFGNSGSFIIKILKKKVARWLSRKIIIGRLLSYSGNPSIYSILTFFNTHYKINGTIFYEDGRSEMIYIVYEWIRNMTMERENSNYYVPNVNIMFRMICSEFEYSGFRWSEFYNSEWMEFWLLEIANFVLENVNARNFFVWFKGRRCRGGRASWSGWGWSPKAEGWGDQKAEAVDASVVYS